ncbi:3-phosphoshikimate 1-carboxyvinyltransferase [Rhodothermus profundi]|uniref:3-phosphoshikimate 1-carboxyvinyltransferase n=1 Tax=Rhodothermus profundi TaxID=633813 RepID=A0A1M6UNT3_9BACT|nr:3-phosphoshikimate 1-carboxyvinyltransferase [Rhodothermus profundi]SHK70831.1 3-phosphoshikimate 1-carboxyvinyltransferase [Rhodothermus profundi]
MIRRVLPARSLLGVVEVPPDKSIAHRAALLAALSEGTSRLVNYSPAADPQSTLSCLRQLGVSITEDAHGILIVEGRGLEGLQPPDRPLDCGNSGTTMRLLAGILAGQPFNSTLVGDASLSRRPMERIAAPLRQMGAALTLTDGHAPIHIRGNRPLRGITYRLPVPSAQVKSCVLLAGLFAEGETTVIEPVPSRDHTERMLGLSVVEMNGERYLTVPEGLRIPPRTWTIPRDFSAAAFFLVAGTIVPDSEIRLPGVGINPSRAALLDVLRAMGADITVENERTYGGEPIADLIVRSSTLHGVQVGGALIPNLIDEIPVLAVAAACATGRTEIRDAAELRVKETDRIAAMAANLQALGAHVEVFDDGLAIEGGHRLQGATVRSFDDHRIAMAMGVAGLVAAGETLIEGADCVRISFPDFWEVLNHLAGHPVQS